LNNRVLIRHRDMGFLTAIDERGISPVESFFLSRARSSEVLIRHHKVAQIAAALRYASVEVFKGQEGQRLLRTIEAILAADDKATPAAVGERLNEFAPYDDTYWLQALRNVERKGAGELLDATLGLILERQQTLRSVWKRRGDMTRDEIAAFNDAIERAVAAQGDQLSFESIRHRLEEKNILIVRHRFRPFQMRPTGVAGESVFQVRTTSGPEPMSLRSPIVASLSAAWEAEPHLHAFCLRNVDSATAKSIVFEAFQVPQRSAAGGAATVDVTGRD
jgi:hypothetical protein